MISSHSHLKIYIQWLVYKVYVILEMLDVAVPHDFIMHIQYLSLQVMRCVQCITVQQFIHYSSPYRWNATMQQLNLMLEVRAEIGRGAFGSVYEVIRKGNSTNCAAKVLHQFHMTRSSAVAKQRFETEYDILSKMCHPNVVQFLGLLFDHKGDPILLMELLEQSLTSFLGDNELPPNVPYYTQVIIIHDIAQALAYLQTQGIVHRDLSSNNILLIGNGAKAKVADFGMAKLMCLSENSQAGNTACPGTELYMPPEAKYSGPWGPVFGHKGDVYSLGVNIVQLLFKESIPLSDEWRHLEYPDHLKPLHEIAERCLNHYECNRPTAADICYDAIQLKDSPHFKVSKMKKKMEPQIIREQEERIQQLEAELQQQPC